MNKKTNVLLQTSVLSLPYFFHQNIVDHFCLNWFFYAIQTIKQQSHFPLFEQTTVRKKKAICYSWDPLSICRSNCIYIETALVVYFQRKNCSVLQKWENTMYVIPAFLKTFKLLMCLDSQNTTGLKCIITAVRELGFSNGEGHKLNNPNKTKPNRRQILTEQELSQNKHVSVIIS